MNTVYGYNANIDSELFIIGTIMLRGGKCCNFLEVNLYFVLA